MAKIAINDESAHSCPPTVDLIRTDLASNPLTVMESYIERGSFKAVKMRVGAGDGEVANSVGSMLRASFSALISISWPMRMAHIRCPKPSALPARSLIAD
jgi:hypothetical protein